MTISNFWTRGQARVIFCIVAATIVAGCQQQPREATTHPVNTAPNIIIGDAPPAWTTIVGDRVFFAFGKANLSSVARATLKRQADFIKKYPTVIVSIEGHCDDVGPRAYNMALGLRRASAVKAYLVRLGIAANRLSTISYGSDRPAVLGNSKSARDQNRRAVSVLE